MKNEKVLATYYLKRTIEFRQFDRELDNDQKLLHANCPASLVSCLECLHIN